jgi:peptidoglycan/LPS O-acetylase OafA/YrhL
VRELSTVVLRFGEFALGLVAGLEIAEGWRPRIPIVAVLALLAVLTVGTSQAHIPSPLPDFAFDPLFLALIVSAAVLDLTGAPGLLTRRSLIYAGQVSFCFYLVHQLIIANLKPVLAGSGLFDPLLLFLAGCAGAAALHHLVELPCQRLLRGRQRRPLRRAQQTRRWSVWRRDPSPRRIAKRLAERMPE